MQSPAKETRARHRTCSILNLHPSLVISISFSYSLVHCALQLAAPLLVRENASAQRLKSQQPVRSRFLLSLVRKVWNPIQTRGCLLPPSISKGAYALYSLPTPLVITKRRSQERKEGLEPSTSALARLCSTIKLFPPATVVAKHY